MGNKRNLYQSKHCFAPYPFEALWSGSWWPVERIRINHGHMHICSVDGQYVQKNCGPLDSLRIRSRPANSSDCICFLRPGIDVCVLSGESSSPIWVDARISSIQSYTNSSNWINAEGNEKICMDFQITLLDVLISVLPPHVYQSIAALQMKEVVRPLTSLTRFITSSIIITLSSNLIFPCILLIFFSLHMATCTSLE